VDVIMFGLYNSFRCIAGKCTSTCCAGWKIIVDNQAYKRFESIKDKVLREDILSNIYETDGIKRFAHKSGRQCAMLDNDGLCRIQRNTSEEMLCNTCRKFPRLAKEHNGIIWLSMSASCPVVADYIIKNKIKFYKTGNKGTADIQDIPFIADETKEYKNILREHISRQKRNPDYIKDYNLFIDVADRVLGIIIESKEILYLEGSFAYFEDEKSVSQVVSQFKAFENMVKENYTGILENYAEYRIFTRYTCMPAEDKDSRLKQVSGELFLIYVIALSRYYYAIEKNTEDNKENVKDKIPGVEWRIIINWVYRMCVHSLEPGKKIHNIFKRYLTRGLEPGI